MEGSRSIEVLLYWERNDILIEVTIDDWICRGTNLLPRVELGYKIINNKLT